MKNVYLIRHGKPDFPGGQKMCIGTTDIPLGEEGLAQAAQMADKLPPVTAVYSSGLGRAVRTAQTIGMTVTVLEGLGETHMGVWEGLSFDRIRRDYPGLYAARKDDMTLLPPEAETPEAALARFSAAMEQAARSAPGDLAVVAHSGVIALFLRSLGGPGRKPDYTQILPLTWEDGIFKIQEEP